MNEKQQSKSCEPIVIPPRSPPSKSEFERLEDIFKEIYGAEMDDAVERIEVITYVSKSKRRFVSFRRGETHTSGVVCFRLQNRTVRRWMWAIIVTVSLVVGRAAASRLGDLLVQ